MGRKLFCDMNPLFYKIAVRRCIMKRHIQNFFSKLDFATQQQEEKLPALVAQFQSHLIKRAPGVELELQENKAVNIRLACSKLNGLIIRPGQTFSFWKLVGATTRRRGYLPGRVIRNNKLVPGMGGGLCNLGNSIHRLVIQSPLTVTELYTHSDALAPDEGPRVPFSAGTSISYNYMDFRFRNDTDQAVQLCLWCEGETLFGQIRAEAEFPECYEITEEGHCFRKEGEKYYRVSKIYKKVTDRNTGELLRKELVWDNHSEVMFDYSLIPQDQIAVQ